jgi:glycosyltransferase involved in cell wall biosynthesis
MCLDIVAEIHLICQNKIFFMANVLSIVTYKIFPPKSGGQKGIAFFNKYFSKHQNLFCVTVKENDPSLADYKVFNLLTNEPSRYFNPFYFFEIKKLIAQNHISHIILEHPYYGWMVLLLKYFCKVKVVVHSHNIEAVRFKSVGKGWWKILFFYEKWIHSQADFTFCITENDRDYFFKNYQIPYQKSAVITYGISWNTIPSHDEIQLAKNYLREIYSLPVETKLFLFNGTLNYGPNLDALKNILDKINPVFSKKNSNYRIIICGKDLPDDLNQLKDYRDQNIIYAGFVNDISLYFKGADVFINPVNYGGGIKTKLVEALGYNLNAVSTVNGAIGIPESVCNEKLLICANEDWQTFADEMAIAAEVNKNLSPAFFKHFYWDNIAMKAAEIVETL